MNDLLPADISAWQHLEACAREVASSYGYEEIRVPLIEHTELFKRAIGEFTDVVEKEMYTFVDQGEDSLTLRPEATAGVMRAVISDLHTELFKRAIGEFTDVVEKEMYTFVDQGEDSLTLRPEATAGVMRAVI